MDSETSDFINHFHRFNNNNDNENNNENDNNKNNNNNNNNNNNSSKVGKLTQAKKKENAKSKFRCDNASLLEKDLVVIRTICCSLTFSSANEI